MKIVLPGVLRIESGPSSLDLMALGVLRCCLGQVVPGEAEIEAVGTEREAWRPRTYGVCSLNCTTTMARC